MAFSANRPTTLKQFIGADFSSFLELSNIHHDSWGLALDDQGSTEVIKHAETAADSTEFASVIQENSGTGGLLHFRWASPGLPVTNENAHPFSYKDISFIHNGALSPYDSLLKIVDSEFLSLRSGQTDSELFFLYLLTEISKSNFLDGVQAAIKNIKANFKYSSINSMIMNPDFLVVVSEHDPVNKPDWADEVYYELRYRLDSHGFAVASSGWPQDGWKLIPNHMMAVFNRKTGELQSLAL